MHALGQVVSYPGPPPSLRSVNAVLPDEIAVLAAEEAPDGFSARHDALSRRYVLPRARAARRRRRSSATARCGGRIRSTCRRCEACAAALAGTHDFTAFTPTETYHQRFRRDVIAASWRARRATC